MKVGFAGAGNMAAAMARGWALGPHGPDAMLFADSGSGRAAGLASELGGDAVDSLEQLADRSDAVVLAVKPAALEAVTPALRGAGVIVSVLGATDTDRLAAAFPQAALLRAMPNVAVARRRGIICHPAPSDRRALAPALELLELLGTVVELPEDQIDAATAVMGCAPAYIARAAAAISAAGVDAGLDRELSDSLVAEGVEGIGALLADNDAAALQRAIASPGGSTEAGLDALTDHGIDEAFEAAVVASLERMAGAR